MQAVALIKLCFTSKNFSATTVIMVIHSNAMHAKFTAYPQECNNIRAYIRCRYRAHAEAFTILEGQNGFNVKRKTTVQGEYSNDISWLLVLR